MRESEIGNDIPLATFIIIGSESLPLADDVELLGGFETMSS